MSANDAESWIFRGFYVGGGRKRFPPLISRRTYSDTVTQRLIFDEGEHEVVVDTCTACRDLCNKFIPDSGSNPDYGNNIVGRREEDGVLIYPAKVISSHGLSPAVDPAFSWFTMKHQSSLWVVEPYEMSVSMWMTRGNWQSAEDDSSSLGSLDAEPVQIEFARLESSHNDGRGTSARLRTRIQLACPMQHGAQRMPNRLLPFFDLHTADQRGLPPHRAVPWNTTAADRVHCLELRMGRRRPAALTADFGLAGCRRPLKIASTS